MSRHESNTWPISRVYHINISYPTKKGTPAKFETKFALQYYALAHACIWHSLILLIVPKPCPVVEVRTIPISIPEDLLLDARGEQGVREEEGVAAAVVVLRRRGRRARPGEVGLRAWRRRSSCSASGGDLGAELLVFFEKSIDRLLSGNCLLLFRL